MPLTGELSDLSLAELIEFFCNQRKTGRLEILYPDGPAHFFLQSGHVVHAEVGALRGIEAVYYALTLPNASFTFSSACEIPQQTINQPWTSVVLEGLRRMDEGITPHNPFTKKSFQPIVEEAKVEVAHEESDSILSSSVKDLEPARLPSVRTPKPVRARTLFSDIQPGGTFAYGHWKLGAIFGAVVLVVAVIAVPWGWYARSKAARMNAEAQTVTAETPPPAVPVSSGENPQPERTNSPSETANNSILTANENPVANPEVTDADKRTREARLREEARLKLKPSESPGTRAATQPAPAVSSTPIAKEQSSPVSGSKRVTVQVTYDENGRVTQASGGDATALRIARQKRFPAGKAGSATVTIPIN